MANLEHLTPDELTLWNELDKAVARLLKDPKQETDYGNLAAKAAAGLRDRIGDRRYGEWSREQWKREARICLDTDEWWHTSVMSAGSEG